MRVSRPPFAACSTENGIFRRSYAKGINIYIYSMAAHYIKGATGKKGWWKVGGLVRRANMCEEMLMVVEERLSGCCADSHDTLYI